MYSYRFEKSRFVLQNDEVYSLLTAVWIDLS